jgi:hypothetical protein
MRGEEEEEVVLLTPFQQSLDVFHCQDRRIAIRTLSLSPCFLPVES